MLIYPLSEQEIDYQMMLELTDEEIAELIATVGGRMKLKAAIKIELERASLDSALKQQFVITLDTVDQVFKPDTINNEVLHNESQDNSSHELQSGSNTLIPGENDFDQRYPFPINFTIPELRFTEDQINYFETGTRLNKEHRKKVGDVLFTELYRIFRKKAPIFHLNLVCYEFIKRFIRMHDFSFNGYEKLKLFIRNKYKNSRPKKANNNSTTSRSIVNETDVEEVLLNENIGSDITDVQDNMQFISNEETDMAEQDTCCSGKDNTETHVTQTSNEVFLGIPVDQSTPKTRKKRKRKGNIVPVKPKKS